MCVRTREGDRYLYTEIYKDDNCSVSMSIAGTKSWELFNFVDRNV